MRQVVLRALLMYALVAAIVCAIQAQTPKSTPNAAPTAQPDAPLDDVHRQLQAQGAEIEQLRAALKEQTQLLQQLLAREASANGAPASVAPATYMTSNVAAMDSLAPTTANNTQVAPSTQTTGAKAPPPAATTAPKPTEITTGVLSSLSFSGDLRLRYEGQFGLLNALPNSADPSVVGNELSARNRTRARLRFAVRGQFGREVAKGEREFQWGLRLATGALTDVNSSNQTLTDFFLRKPVGIDQAFITYKPARVPGLRLQAGKFEPPWLSTEMTIDVDLMPEGLNELYSRDFKDSKLKNLTFVAWQLPFLERNSAFVLGPDGRVSVDQSRRAGRDLALYGAQVRGRFDLTPHAGLTLSAADLYYSGTQFINVAQFFGAQLQIPITFTIPATTTTPTQTINTVVNIPRDALVSGANTGTSVANTNAVNRDGRLSSGYNLVDLIARLDLTNSKRFPVALLFDFVHNTQVHDVVVAGTGGANRLLPNHEDNGYWAELQVGKNKAAGDVLFGYTFLRIEKDAVLTPFNFSDILQPSDVRVHRLGFTYTVDPRVLLTVTDIISQRPNGLLGPFGATPPGSLNRATHRLQLDTVFRF
ncbi:MAG: putative porin [Pyrinomonadaceae bacterium]